MYKLIPALSGAYVRLEKASTGPIRVGRAKRAFRVSCVKGVNVVIPRHMKDAINYTSDQAMHMRVSGVHHT